MTSREAQAVSIIQRFFRVHLKSLLTFAFLEHTMSLKIQKAYRGYFVRRQLNKLSQAALKIQAFYHTKKSHSQFKTLLKSVRKIQSFTRMFLLRSKVIKEKLSVYLNKEQAFMKHSELFPSQPRSGPPSQDPLKTLSAITENSAFHQYSELLSTGSIALQSKPVSPFHLEKLYFFLRPFDLQLLTDASIVYDPLWSTQFETLNKDLLSKEEQILDISIGSCHTLALSSKGKVYVWGWNDKNQCMSAGTKPRMLEQSKDLKISQISCGDDHSLLLTASGDVYSFGDNSKGQLGNSSYNTQNSLTRLPISQCKQVEAVGSQNMVVTCSGELYLWPFDTLQGERRSYPTKMLTDILVLEVSLGYNFAMILSTSGLLFSLGTNTNGQLGQGDVLPRSAPTLISSLKRAGERISSVSCGCRHVIVRSSLGKIFTWGSGDSGQLGNADGKDETTPKAIKINEGRIRPAQVSAGYLISLVMMENRKVWATGKGGFVDSCEFVEINVIERMPEALRNNPEFAVVKVRCEWSRVVAIVVAVFADLRYLKEGLKGSAKLNNALGMIAVKWSERCIEPPVVESVVGYYPAGLCRKISQKSPVRTNGSGKSYEDIKERISGILKKPSGTWTAEEKLAMEHLKKLKNNN